MGRFEVSFYCQRLEHLGYLAIATCNRFYLIFLIIFSVLQTVLLYFNRLKIVVNTGFVVFVGKLIMLGSVVQVHLSPPA